MEASDCRSPGDATNVHRAASGIPAHEKRESKTHDPTASGQRPQRDSNPRLALPSRMPDHGANRGEADDGDSNAKCLPQSRGVEEAETSASSTERGSQALPGSSPQRGPRAATLQFGEGKGAGGEVLGPQNAAGFIPCVLERSQGHTHK